jgi:predicted exporter
VTDHRRWLELAALRPTFSPSAAEATDLDAHLAACDACSREAAALRADLALVARLEVPAPRDDVRMRVRAAAIAADVRRGTWNLATIAAVGLLAAALVGATLGVGALLNRPDEALTDLNANEPALAAIDGKRIRWETEVVRLGADSVRIEANGLTLRAESP